MRISWGAAATLPVLLVAGAVALGERPAWQRDDRREVAEGRGIYLRDCASCHGAALEGQPRWWAVGSDGLLPAPPQDQTGHTWQHSDAALRALILQGPATFAAPGYRSAMPAFDGRLTRPQANAVIAYIRSTWPPGVRAYQAAQNPGGPSLVDIPGDWTFPPTCNLSIRPRSDDVP